MGSLFQSNEWDPALLAIDRSRTDNVYWGIRKAMELSPGVEPAGRSSAFKAWKNQLSVAHSLRGEYLNEAEGYNVGAMSELISHVDVVQLHALSTADNNELAVSQLAKDWWKPDADSDNEEEAFVPVEREDARDEVAESETTIPIATPVTVQKVGGGIVIDFSVVLENHMESIVSLLGSSIGDSASHAKALRLLGQWRECMVGAQDCVEGINAIVCG